MVKAILRITNLNWDSVPKEPVCEISFKFILALGRYLIVENLKLDKLGTPHQPNIEVLPDFGGTLLYLVKGTIPNNTFPTLLD